MKTSASPRLSRRGLMFATMSTAIFTPTSALSAPTIHAGTNLNVVDQTDSSVQFENLGSLTGFTSTNSQGRIVDLQTWQNRIYAGYGDWITNTGPISAMCFDIDQGEIIHDDNYEFSEEAVETFVVLDGVLYAVGTDALESWDFGNLYRKYPDSAWEKLRTVPGGVHLFGVGAVGGVLVASGSDDQANGVIWQSSDDGYSWETVDVFSAPASDNENPIVVRGYVVTTEDRVFVPTPTDSCRIFDGSTWTSTVWESSPSRGVNHAVQFGENAVMVSYSDSGIVTDKELFFFDGSRQWNVDIGAKAQDLVVENDILYVLAQGAGTKGTILATRELLPNGPESFRIVAQVGIDVIGLTTSTLSLERADGRFFIGCSDGSLLRSTPADF